MSLARELLAVIAPPACAGCRAPVGASAPLLCPSCSRELPWLGNALCPRCGLPAHGRGCPAAGAAFARAWAPVAYHGVARAVVRELKFGRCLPLAGLMAAQIAAGAPPGLLAGALVPVPAAPMRARRRGFDPAAAIAGALSGRTGLPLAACLRRRGAAARQLGASRAERRAAGRLVVEALGVPPAVAVLVDDVHTTGATLEACASALRAAGAHTVHAVTYARTLPRTARRAASTPTADVAGAGATGTRP